VETAADQVEIGGLFILPADIAVILILHVGLLLFHCTHAMFELFSILSRLPKVHVPFFQTRKELRAHLYSNYHKRTRHLSHIRDAYLSLDLELQP
jgi:hypothetical protein